MASARCRYSTPSSKRFWRTSVRHYLDGERSPRGPVSREQLDQLFQSGTITPETDVLEAGATGWTKYATLNG